MLERWLCSAWVNGTEQTLWYGVSATTDQGPLSPFVLKAFPVTGLLGVILHNICVHLTCFVVLMFTAGYSTFLCIISDDVYFFFLVLSVIFQLQTEKMLLAKQMRETLIIPCQLNNLRCYFSPRQTELMGLKYRICSVPPGSLVLKKAPAVMMYWSHRYHKMQHILFFFNPLFSGTEYHPQTMFSMLALYYK